MAGVTAERANPDFDFNVPSNLSHHHVPRSDFFLQHADVQGLIVGAMVFHQDRVLLIQRSVREPAYPLMWEVPGGCCEASDATILHAVARELYEETGLLVKEFNHEIGHGVSFQTSERNGICHWRKLTFDVNVHTDERSCRPIVSETNDHETAKFQVRLDDREHQAWVWATADEVDVEMAGNTRLQFITTIQKKVILEGFESRKAKSLATA